MLLTRHKERLHTSVYRKSTNTGDCLNFNSLCPEKYKISVIRTFLHRAHSVTSTWESFHQEIIAVRQLLTNNGYPISLLEKEIYTFINSKFDTKTNGSPTQAITIFYKNQFTSNYRQDERLIKQIVSKHVTPTGNDSTINTCIYYKSKKLRQFIISNKSSNVKTSKSRVVYQYTCKDSACNGASYIGYTTCTLPLRFYSHVQNGSINRHNKQQHHAKLFTQQLLETTKVLYSSSSTQDLLIAEALLIKECSPTLNAQEEGQERILCIF